MGLMARQGTQHRVPHHVVVAKCQWAEIPVVSVWCGEKYGTFQNKLAKRGFHYMIWNYYFCSIFIFNFKIQISRSEVAVTYFQTMESLRHCWRYHLVLTDPELCRWWGHIFWGTSCLFTYFNSNVMALLYNIMLWKIMSFYCYDSIFLVAPSFLGAVFCPVQAMNSVLLVNSRDRRWSCSLYCACCWWKHWDAKVQNMMGLLFCPLSFLFPIE